MINSNNKDKRGTIAVPAFTKTDIKRVPGIPTIGFSEDGCFLIDDGRDIAISAKNNDLIFTARSRKSKRLLVKLFDKLRCK